MSHLIALQRQHDLRWDYTINNVPAGYCRQWRDWDEAIQKVSRAAYEKALSFKDKHHGDGHETAEQACACYKEYLLDQRLSLNHKNSGSQHRCKVCGEWTQMFAMVGAYDLFFLCDAHHNRDEIAKLLIVGESWES